VRENLTTCQTAHALPPSSMNKIGWLDELATADPYPLFPKVPAFRKSPSIL